MSPDECQLTVNAPGTATMSMRLPAHSLVFNEIAVMTSKSESDTSLVCFLKAYRYRTYSTR